MRQRNSSVDGSDDSHVFEDTSRVGPGSHGAYRWEHEIKPDRRQTPEPHFRQVLHFENRTCCVILYIIYIIYLHAFISVRLMDHLSLWAESVCLSLAGTSRPALKQENFPASPSSQTPCRTWPWYMAAHLPPRGEKWWTRM